MIGKQGLNNKQMEQFFSLVKLANYAQLNHMKTEINYETERRQQK